MIMLTIIVAAIGVFVGFVASMWGGIQVIVPVAASILALVFYVAGRLTFAAYDSFKE
jgi:hypothetical protein